MARLAPALSADTAHEANGRYDARLFPAHPQALMGLAALLQHPALFALAALLLAFFAAAWLLGAFQTERDEARAGVLLLCAMRWNEFSRLISEMLKDRGMQPSATERAPGKDGFDLLFTRGNTRYLVQCMNGATQHVSAQSVGSLHNLTQMQDADGAIITTCGSAEPSALRLAQDRRIEIIAGEDLWTHVKPWVAHDQRVDAEAAAQALKRRRLLTAALIALLAALATYTLVAMLAPDAPAAAPQASAAAPLATAPARPSPPPPAAGAVALPDAKLNEEQLASRRAAALLEVRGLTRIASASWSTKSTLLVALHDRIDDAPLENLVQDICRSLLQYEELRYLRLQLDVPTGNPEHPVQVRWRQCR